MFWVIVGYLAFAIACNFFCSLIVGLKLINKCEPMEDLYDEMFQKHFMREDQWIESELALPNWARPLFKTVFFPFNMASLIRCYLNASKDADDILKGE